MVVIYNQPKKLVWSKALGRWGREESSNFHHPCEVDIMYFMKDFIYSNKQNIRVKLLLWVHRQSHIEKSKLTMTVYISHHYPVTPVSNMFMKSAI